MYEVSMVNKFLTSQIGGSSIFSCTDMDTVFFPCGKNNLQTLFDQIPGTVLSGLVNILPGFILLEQSLNGAKGYMFNGEVPNSYNFQQVRMKTILTQIETIQDFVMLFDLLKDQTIAKMFDVTNNRMYQALGGIEQLIIRDDLKAGNGHPLQANWASNYKSWVESYLADLPVPVWTWCSSSIARLKIDPLISNEEVTFLNWIAAAPGFSEAAFTLDFGLTWQAGTIDVPQNGPCDTTSSILTASTSASVSPRSSSSQSTSISASCGHLEKRADGSCPFSPSAASATNKQVSTTVDQRSSTASNSGTPTTTIGSISSATAGSTTSSSIESIESIESMSSSTVSSRLASSISPPQSSTISPTSSPSISSSEHSITSSPIPTPPASIASYSPVASGISVSSYSYCVAECDCSNGTDPPGLNDGTCCIALLTSSQAYEAFQCVFTTPATTASIPTSVSTNTSPTTSTPSALPTSPNYGVWIVYYEYEVVGPEPTTYGYWRFYDNTGPSPPQYCTADPVYQAIDMDGSYLPGGTVNFDLNIGNKDACTWTNSGNKNVDSQLVCGGNLTICTTVPTAQQVEIPCDADYNTAITPIVMCMYPSTF